MQECKRHGFDPWVGKIPWRRAWQPTPVFLPGESRWQRSLGTTVYGVSKSWMWLKQLITHAHLSLLHPKMLCLGYPGTSFLMVLPLSLNFFLCCPKSQHVLAPFWQDQATPYFSMTLLLQLYLQCRLFSPFRALAVTQKPLFMSPVIFLGNII